MKKISFISITSFILCIIGTFIFYPIFISNNIIFKYSIHPFNICTTFPQFWLIFKILFIILYIFSSIITLNIIYKILFKPATKSHKTISYDLLDNSINLYLGKHNKENIYIPSASLYQNILITGSIGSGKTSSAMYPFTKQLIEYMHFDKLQKIGILILDVKGNYHKKVYEYCTLYNRIDDLIIIELDGKYTYNPLDKPNLAAAVLANKIKTILLLFSQNNSESFWLDKVEQILTEAIKLCRLYNSNYVTFDELHNLINSHEYYNNKILLLRKLFLENTFTLEDNYNLLTAINFFEDEYWKLDSRTISILKSEITRITELFVSNYKVNKTFCPSKNNINFKGFSDLINNGKIVVLNMNISEYKNISKIIAAYLKLDFQSEVLSRLSKDEITRNVAFICDEYHEYVTETDSDFLAQSRESKCINIMSTQSYSSLLNTIQNETTLRVLLQNIVNKLWFRTDDIYTIENIQKQLGKEEKEKFSETISENSNETHYNFLTKSFLSNKSNISESINRYFQYDYIYDANFFTQNLETFSCLAFLSNGKEILSPLKLNLIPYFSEGSQNEKK